MALPPSHAESSSSAPIDYRLVRRLFSQPARVAESGFLRREIAARMHERLSLVKISPQRVLDAGCGDGSDLPLLQSTFSDAHLLAVDASSAMLGAAHDKQVTSWSSMRRLLARWLGSKVQAGPGASGSLICGDFARLPLPASSVDLVWSNLALHWHSQPDQVFNEWRRVLRVDGLLMFSCLGPDTFRQLRAAFAAADAHPHVLPFVDMHDLGDMLIHAGFSTPVMDMEMITVTYPTAEKLLADVRAWGGNPLATRRRALLGKNAWKRVVDALEQSRTADGRIPLSFEVVYGHAFRPVQTRTAAGESIVRLDLRKK